MTAGINSGGQLNIVLFEVGIIKRIDLGGIVGIRETITPVGIHPLVVAPTSIAYDDASRSPLTQTVGGALLTRAGRALRRVSLSGQWGVAARGIGPYVGTGEVRRQRFYNEVVRLPEARGREQVDACIDPLTGTPFLRQLLTLYNEKDTTFYVNCYDFYNGQSFECRIDSFRWVRAYGNGGATGNVAYQMTLTEAGPIVGAGGVQAVLRALFGGLTTWRDLNETIRSYSPAALVNSIYGVPAIVVSQINASIAAFDDAIDPVVQLFGSASPADGEARAAAAAASGDLRTSVQGLAASSRAAQTYIDARRTGIPDEDTGVVPWSSLVGEGSNPEFDRLEEIDRLAEVQDAAAWQSCAGILFGMSREDFQAYLSSAGGGDTPGPATRGSTPYVVQGIDTPERIEALFGIAWSDILAANDRTPDEALYPGTELLIPQPRAFGSGAIAGLPVFGSHLGRAAWGSDLAVDGEIVDGRPVVVALEPVLEQGMLILMQEIGDGLLEAAKDAPIRIVDTFVGLRLQRAILSDARIASVGRLDVQTEAQAAALRFTVEANAINGGQIRTAGGSVG